MDTLNKRRQLELIDKYRDAYVNDHGWDSELIEQFKQDMSDIGVQVDGVYWSGFWSQGDGACFEGHIKDWGKYLTYLGYTDHILTNTAIEWWSYRFTHRGNYCHENSVDYDNNIFLPESPYVRPWQANEIGDADIFRDAVWNAAMARYDLLELSEKIEANLKQHMVGLYKKLEQEYEHLTSDESVIGFLKANEIKD